MSGRAFTVIARDRDLSKLGTINGYTSLSVTPRFNAVGSWALTYPEGSAGAKLLGAGRGVRIFREGATSGPPIMSGPVTALAESLSPDRKTPQVTFTGACDNLALARRLALPDPGVDGDVYPDAYDVRAGAAETVMKAFVDANAGPGALLDRRVADLVLEADLGRGASVTYSARFPSLLALLQDLAQRGGLGFRVQQIGSRLVFSTYVPTDRRKLVRFSTATKSLGAYSYALTAPTGTTAYVGDATPGAGRSFARFTDELAESDWGMRAEVFVDSSSTTDPAEIAQSGAQALASGSPQAQVSFTPLDTPQRRYGTDYGLGDTVTVRLGLGDVVDVVREVTITDTADNGVQIRPTVGGTQATDPSSTPAIYRAYRLLAAAVGNLQRRH